MVCHYRFLFLALYRNKEVYVGFLSTFTFAKNRLTKKATFRGLKCI